MSREDVESHPSPSHNRSRSCEAPGRPSVVDFLQGSMPPPEKRSLLPADGFSLSPVSAYSCTGSWSGSSNTEEQRSPLTPEFAPPAVATVVRSNETPITAFLSQFYDAEPSPDAVQLRFSVTEDLHRLDLFKDRKEDVTMLMQLPVYPPEGALDHIIAEIPDGPLQVLPEADSLDEAAPVVAEHEIEPHPPLPDVRRARRFACDFISAGWSQRPPSVRSDWDPAIPQSTRIQETSVASQELDASLALADLSAPSSTVPLAFEFPCPPHMYRNIGLLSERETKKVQEFLRAWGEREGRRSSAEDASMLHHDNAPQVPSRSGDRASDEFSWEAGDSDGDVVNEPGDATRCSALIHEVSLMVGLPSDEDQALPGDGRPPVPDVPENVECTDRDTAGTTDTSVARQPLSPPETQFSSPRRPRNTCPPSPKTTRSGVRTTDAPISPKGELQDERRRVALHGDYPFLARKFKSVDALPIKSPQLPPILPLSPQKSLGVRPRVDVPIPRYKSAENVRLSQSARRRQGQLFTPGDSIDHRPNRSLVDMDEAFVRPREPVPKPTTSPTNRISALDRLETSLNRLKAHAPGHHHKSRSEAEGSRRAFEGLGRATEKRPSLPSVLRPRKQRSSHDILYRNVARPARGHHSSSSVPPISGPSWAAPQDATESTCATAPSNVACPSGKHTTVGSFMDMDAHIVQKPTQPHRASFRSSVNKEKVKKLVRAAARMSQGVVAWGKNLAGSIKSGNTREEISPSQSA